MAAAGRLWRRAPAWRLCLVTAVGLTGLAAMFPPAMPDWGRGLRDQAAAALHEVAPALKLPAAVPQTGARFVPVPDAAPTGAGELAWPPSLGTGRSGIMAFAGRQIPLPPGQWQVMLLARDEAAIPVQDEVLARVEAGQVTGLIEVLAPNAINGAALPLMAHAGCFTGASLASEAVPESFGQDPSLHECWALSPSDMTSPAARPDVDPVLRRGMDRLDSIGAALPGRMLALQYLRADPTGWIKVLLLLPDRRAEAKLVAWARGYTKRLHVGFAGGLKEAGGDRDPA